MFHWKHIMYYFYVKPCIKVTGLSLWIARLHSVVRFSVFLVMFDHLPNYCCIWWMWGGPSGCLVKSVGLQLLACWDCRFESHWGAWLLVCCECCQVEISVLGWSLIHRNCFKCGVSQCDHEILIIRRLWPTGDCCAIKNDDCVSCIYKEVAFVKVHN
jgi:hypothetical protein